MEAKLSRNRTLDIMKGIGIILVVLYHAMGASDKSMLEVYHNGLYNMIASVFMLMFFVISGYLVYGKIGEWGWTWRHIVKWLPAIIIFGAVYWAWSFYVLNRLHFPYGEPLNVYAEYVLMSGFAGVILWYLWAMLLCYLVTYLIEKARISANNKLVGLIIIGVIIVINLFPFDGLGIVNLKWYGIFFFIGYAIRHYKGWLGKFNKLSYACLILFPLVGWLLGWLQPFETELAHLGLAFPVLTIINGDYALLGVTFLMALLGTGFVYSLAKIKVRYLSNALAYIGASSIGIYLLHILFVSLSSNYLISFVIALVLGLGLYEILKRIKITNKLLFGGFYG